MYYSKTQIYCRFWGNVETCSESGFAVSGFWFLGSKIGKKGWESPLIYKGDISDSLTIVLSKLIVH